MKHPVSSLAACLGLIVLVISAAARAADPASIEDAWANPPRDARLRAYWWWLNGNVTKESITRDLEQMKAKGFGGALVCDAGGAEQFGNAKVPHGPTFFSLEWRELYKHTLREANRLGLEMSLNIMSGWNLGGPMVAADDAPKKLAWTDRTVSGPKPFAEKLARPKARDDYYRDLFVLAWPVKEPRGTDLVFSGVSASSAQPGFPAANVCDANLDTYWVSDSAEPGGGPTPDKPQWLQFNFTRPVLVNQLTLNPRPAYGPRDCELQASDDGKTFRSLKSFTANQKEKTFVAFAVTTGSVFRILFTSAFDPRYPQSPRNVQVSEVQLSGPDGSLTGGNGPSRRPLENWEQKALLKALNFSAPDTTPLLVDYPAQPGEEDTQVAKVMDLTAKLDADGTLRWDIPEGSWEILRLGCTLNDHCHVSTCSDGWSGYALDPFDAGAFKRYWDAVVEPLIADAGTLAGTTLKYLHTDSWEVEVANWTPALREEFGKRRGYDLLPWLPVITGHIVNSRTQSDRFLNDFRRTMGDLAIANHYQLFRDGAHRHGLLIHPESGGPHAVPIDAQQCLGFNDAPMSEFWAWSWMHRVGDENRFFVKQPASAAHVYGHNLVLAEGFTTIGPHWQERIWENLKPSFDHACTEGLNLLVWHAFVCSPASEGLPGQQYFAGTHLNPNVTWWEKSAPFFAYLNRCQALLQRGLPVADAAYYYGNQVPNFAQLRRSDPARLGPGYDYDVFTEEAILTRAGAKDGRIVLPGGMSYGVLVLPERPAISLPVLRKLKELAAAGATIIGPRPETPMSLQEYPQCDTELLKVAGELWSSDASTLHPFGKGRIIASPTAREVLLSDGVPPDFEADAGPGRALDYIHRRDGRTEIYFLSNRSNATATAQCSFRVHGLAPELWNPVTAEHRFAAAYGEKDGRTVVPLEFGPCGSWFVVFREPADKHPATARSNSVQFVPFADIGGPWTVAFDPNWGGPASIQFDSLADWTTRPEPGIKFYSGAATYTKTLELPQIARQKGTRLFLDLGDVRELAEVKMNSKSLGIVWSPPFRVEITDALAPGSNQLEILVVNFWPNRIIGDQALPPAERRTRTNVRKLTAGTPLMVSGLLGPVRIESLAQP